MAPASGIPLQSPPMKPLANLSSPYGNVVIHRNEHGIPVVEAETRSGLYFGQGWIQAHDRQIQTLLMKAIFTGRMSELLGANDTFIAIDTYMRRYGFALDADAEWAKLPEPCRAGLQAHADGINARLHGRRLVWELRVAGLAREDWTFKDTLAIGRGFGFAGLADGQGMLEKWLMQVLCGGTTLPQLRELFPSICDPDFSELYRQVTLVGEMIPASVRELRAIPSPRGSNNWVLAPSRSASGAALAASDPHLDVNRMPAIWQEIVLCDPDVAFVGVGLPGAPGALVGRTQHLSWSPTYSCIDSIDLRIEECHGGRYRRGDGWRDFDKRVDVLKQYRWANPAPRFRTTHKRGALRSPTWATPCRWPRRSSQAAHRCHSPAAGLKGGCAGDGRGDDRILSCVAARAQALQNEGPDGVHVGTSSQPGGKDFDRLGRADPAERQRCVGHWCSGSWASWAWIGAAASSTSTLAANRAPKMAETATAGLVPPTPARRGGAPLTTPRAARIHRRWDGRCERRQTVACSGGAGGTQPHWSDSCPADFICRAELLLLTPRLAQSRCS
jgi:hypothetical protein